MSEAAARFRQPIDLDEFERRLRAGNTSSETSKIEDPLAELARLVGQQDPFRSAPQLRPAAPARSSASADRIQIPHLQQVHPPLERHDPPFSSPESQAPSLDFGATQPGSLEPEPHHFASASALAPAIEDEVVAAPAEHADFHASEPSLQVPSAAVIAATDVPRRSWRGVIILSTVLATGFAGLAAALTMKHSALSSVAMNGGASKGGLPVILAGGPTKVQPPKGAAETPDDQPSVLDKSAAAKPAKAKLVDNVERPVDLSQQPPASPPAAHNAKADSAPVAAANSAPVAAANPSSLASMPPGRQVASLDPIAASPSSLAGSAPVAREPQSAPAPRTATDDAQGRAAPPPGPNGFPSPKRVKIVSVRPDGSIIGSDPDAPAAVAAPAPTVAAVPASPPEPEPPPQIALGVAMPDGSGPSAAPPPSPPDAASAPRAVEQRANSATPAGQANSAAPAGQSNSATPAGQSNSATPAGQANSAAPAGQSNSAAPAGQSNSATPAGQTTGAAPAGNDKRSKDPVAALIDPAGAGRTASTKPDSARNVAAAKPEPGPAPAPKSRRGKKKIEMADLANQDKAGAAAATGAGDGTYAAQLAASPTESAARSTLRKLQKKYGGVLTGHKLSYRRVKVDGKTVYRVRVNGLSKDDANSVCGKLQSDGGTCFVANN